MLLSMQAVLLGSERKVSSKTGNPYDVLLVGQGVDTFNAMVRIENFDSKAYPLYQPYDISLEYNSKYNQFAIVGFSSPSKKS